MLYDKKWDTKTILPLQPWQLILLQAADELETNGWYQGNFANHNLDNNKISHCALGAIRHVGGSAEDRYRAEVELGRALRLPIVAWNDHPSNTKEEVVAKLREVAMSKIKI